MRTNERGILMTAYSDRDCSLDYREVSRAKSCESAGSGAVCSHDYAESGRIGSLESTGRRSRPTLIAFILIACTLIVAAMILSVQESYAMGFITKTSANPGKVAVSSIAAAPAKTVVSSIAAAPAKTVFYSFAATPGRAVISSAKATDNSVTVKWEIGRAHV